MDAQVLIGFEGRAYQVRDFYCSQLLANILGGGMSSRLFQEVREKRGLCYSVYAFHWGFSDSGLFGVHAATGAEDLAELIPVVLSELAKTADGVEEQEINRSRAQVRSGLLMAQESPAARASQIARQMLLFGRPVSNEELMERLANLTPQRLSDLAGKLFFDTPITVSAIGPVDALHSVSSMAGILRSARRANSRCRVSAEDYPRHGPSGVSIPQPDPGRVPDRRAKNLSAQSRHGRLSRMEPAACGQPDLSGTVGAEMGGGRSDPQRLPLPYSPL
jgi:hypothetical protein